MGREFFVVMVVLCGMAITAPGAAAQGQFSTGLRISDLTLSVELLPGLSRIDVQADMTLENVGPISIREFELFLTRAARVRQVSGEDREPLPYRREFSALPHFERLTVLPRDSLEPGQKTTASVRYALEVDPTRSRRWGTVVSEGHSYLLDTWFPTVNPILDAQGYLGDLPRVPFRVRVKAPEGEEVIASGERLPELESGYVTFSQPDAVPISIPVIAGDYQQFTRLLSGMWIDFYLSPQAADGVKEPELLELGQLVARTIRQNDRWFGVLSRDRVRVVLGDFGELARGFPFLLLLPENALTGGLTLEERAVVCHEISHTWFGNAVTGVGAGGNEWLNEGLTTWVSALHIESIDGRDASQQLFREWRRELFESDLEPTPLASLRPYQNLLSREGYLKGALVLHELRKEVGRVALIRGLRDWFREYRGQTCTLEQFERAFARSVGRDLRAFFDQWLRSSDLPQYRLLRWSSERTETAHRVRMALSNRGRGRGLVTVRITGLGGYVEELLVGAEPGTTVQLITSLPYAAEKVEVNPDQTDLEGLRWKSLLTRAKVLRREGDLDTAESVLLRILESNPEPSEVWYQLGRVRDDSGRAAEALEAYTQAIEMATAREWTGPWSRFRRASIFLRLGEPEAAERAIRPVLVGPENPYGVRDRARSLLSDIEKAKRASS